MTHDQVPILRYTAGQFKVSSRSDNWQPWPMLSRPSLDGVGTAISLHLIPARTNILLLKKTVHRSPITAGRYYGGLRDKATEALRRHLCRADANNI